MAYVGLLEKVELMDSFFFGQTNGLFIGFDLPPESKAKETRAAQMPSIWALWENELWIHFVTWPIFCSDDKTHPSVSGVIGIISPIRRVREVLYLGQLGFVSCNQIQLTKKKKGIVREGSWIVEDGLSCLSVHVTSFLS